MKDFLAKNRNGLDLPSFKKPPVIEVVCGVRFKALKSFRAPHFGLFWNKLRNDYPECRHAPPLGPLPAPVSAEDFPMPRVWFLSRNGGSLIQLQNDRILFNWRRVSEKEEYPRYRKVVSAFKESFGSFDGFVRKMELGDIKPLECELTYINHIKQGEGWESQADIDKVFTDLRWKASTERFLPVPTEVNWRLVFPLPDDCGHLTVHLQRARRRSDDLQVLVFELSCHGIGGLTNVPDIWKWFDVAREWIVRGFGDLTSSEIQKKVWLRENH